MWRALGELEEERLRRGSGPRKQFHAENAGSAEKLDVNLCVLRVLCVKLLSVFVEQTRTGRMER